MRRIGYFIALLLLAGSAWAGETDGPSLLNRTITLPDSTDYTLVIQETKEVKMLQCEDKKNMILYALCIDGKEPVELWYGDDGTVRWRKINQQKGNP